jgi:hypothetical protein
MKTITIPETRFDVLRSLLETRPVRLLQDDQVKGFFLPPEQYEAVIELLEDIEDLQDALEAEAEYQAGQSRLFAEYDAERRARTGGGG